MALPPRSRAQACRNNKDKKLELGSSTVASAPSPLPTTPPLRTLLVAPRATQQRQLGVEVGV